MGGLRDFSAGLTLEEDIRRIMRAEGATDLSTEACKEWARVLIRGCVPWWTPGSKLNAMERERIGAVFSYRLDKVRGTNK